MIEKLKQIFNVVIKEEVRGSYYTSLSSCEKCGCPVFSEELMCPECLTPRSV